MDALEEAAHVRTQITDAFDRILGDPTMHAIFVRRTQSIDVETTKNAIIDDLMLKGAALESAAAVQNLSLFGGTTKPEDTKPKTPDQLWQEAFTIFSAPGDDPPVRDDLFRNTLAEIAATQYVQSKHSGWKPRDGKNAYQGKLIDEEVARKVKEAIGQARQEAEKQVASPAYTISSGHTAADKLIIDNAIDSVAQGAVGQINWEQLETTMSGAFSGLLKSEAFQTADPDTQKKMVKAAVKTALGRDFGRIFPGTIDLSFGGQATSQLQPDPVSLWPQSAKDDLIEKIADQVSSRMGGGQQDPATPAIRKDEGNNLTSVLASAALLAQGLTLGIFTRARISDAGAVRAYAAFEARKSKHPDAMLTDEEAAAIRTSRKNGLPKKMEEALTSYDGEYVKVRADGKTELLTPQEAAKQSGTRVRVVDDGKPTTYVLDPEVDIARFTEGLPPEAKAAVKATLIAKAEAIISNDGEQPAKATPVLTPPKAATPEEPRTGGKARPATTGSPKKVIRPFLEPLGPRESVDTLAGSTIWATFPPSIDPTNPISMVRKVIPDIAFVNNNLNASDMARTPGAGTGDTLGPNAQPLTSDPSDTGLPDAVFAQLTARDSALWLRLAGKDSGPTTIDPVPVRGPSNRRSTRPVEVEPGMPKGTRGQYGATGDNGLGPRQPGNPVEEERARRVFEADKAVQKALGLADEPAKAPPVQDSSPKPPARSFLERLGQWWNGSSKKTASPQQPAPPSSDPPAIAQEWKAPGATTFLPGPGEFVFNFGPSGNYLLTGPNGLGNWVRYRTSGASEHTGWKLHVSATTPEAQAKLAELAMQYKIGEFKFAPPDLLLKFQNPTYRQSGKTAVFYHTDKGTDGKPIDWQAFIQDAEKIVIENGGPGPPVQRDATIPGSKAVYYRNDRGAKGEGYIARDNLTLYGKRNNIPESQLFNLSGATNPFADISLGSNQVPIKPDGTSRSAAVSKPKTRVEQDFEAVVDKMTAEAKAALITDYKTFRDVQKQFTLMEQDADNPTNFESIKTTKLYEKYTKTRSLIDDIQREIVRDTIEDRLADADIEVGRAITSKGDGLAFASKDPAALRSLREELSKVGVETVPGRSKDGRSVLRVRSASMDEVKALLPEGFTPEAMPTIELPPEVFPIKRPRIGNLRQRALTGGEGTEPRVPGGVDEQGNPLPERPDERAVRKTQMEENARKAAQEADAKTLDVKVPDAKAPAKAADPLQVPDASVKTVPRVNGEGAADPTKTNAPVRETTTTPDASVKTTEPATKAKTASEGGLEGMEATGFLGTLMAFKGIENWDKENTFQKLTTGSFVGASSVELIGRGMATGAGWAQRLVGASESLEAVATTGGAMAKGAGTVVSPLIVIAGVTEVGSAAGHSTDFGKGYTATHGAVMTTLGINGMLRAGGVSVGGKAVPIAGELLIMWDVANMITKPIDGAIHGDDGYTLPEAIEHYYEVQKQIQDGYVAQPLQSYTAYGLKPEIGEYKNLLHAVSRLHLIDEDNRSDPNTYDPYELRSAIQNAYDHPDKVKLRTPLNDTDHRMLGEALKEMDRDLVREIKADSVNKDNIIYDGYTARYRRFERLKEQDPELATDAERMAFLIKTIKGANANAYGDKVEVELQVDGHPVKKRAVEHLNDLMAKRYMQQVADMRQLHAGKPIETKAGLARTPEEYMKQQQAYAEKLELDPITAQSLFIQSPVQLEGLIMSNPHAWGKKLSMQDDFGVMPPMMQDVFAHALSERRLTLTYNEVTGEKVVRLVDFAVDDVSRYRNKSTRDKAQNQIMQDETNHPYRRNHSIAPFIDYYDLGKGDQVYNIPYDQVERFLDKDVKATLDRDKTVIHPIDLPLGDYSRNASFATTLGDGQAHTITMTAWGKVPDDEIPLHLKADPKDEVYFMEFKDGEKTKRIIWENAAVAMQPIISQGFSGSGTDRAMSRILAFQDADKPLTFLPKPYVLATEYGANPAHAFYDSKLYDSKLDGQNGSVKTFLDAVLNDRRVSEEIIVSEIHAKERQQKAEDRKNKKSYDVVKSFDELKQEWQQAGKPHISIERLKEGRDTYDYARNDTGTLGIRAWAVEVQDIKAVEGAPNTYDMTIRWKDDIHTATKLGEEKKYHIVWQPNDKGEAVIKAFYKDGDPMSLPKGWKTPGDGEPKIKALEKGFRVETDDNSLKKFLIQFMEEAGRAKELNMDMPGPVIKAEELKATVKPALAETVVAELEDFSAILGTFAKLPFSASDRVTAKVPTQVAAAPPQRNPNPGKA